MTNGLVCQKCGFLSIQWEYKDKEGIPNTIFENFIIESMPMSCRNCILGDYKIVHNLNPNSFCFDCDKVLNRCKCGKDKWNDF